MLLRAPQRFTVSGCSLNPPEAIHLLIDGPHRFLKGDLLRRSRTHDLREIAAMCGVPIRASDIVQPAPQEECFQAQLGVLHRDPRRIARAAEIADGFVLHRGHVHRREIAGAQETCKRDGIASIRLDLVAGLLRDQGRATT